MKELYPFSLIGTEVHSNHLLTIQASLQLRLAEWKYIFGNRDDVDVTHLRAHFSEYDQVLLSEHNYFEDKKKMYHMIKWLQEQHRYVKLHMKLRKNNASRLTIETAAKALTEASSSYDMTDKGMYMCNHPNCDFVGLNGKAVLRHEETCIQALVNLSYDKAGVKAILGLRYDFNQPIVMGSVYKRPKLHAVTRKLLCNIARVEYAEEPAGINRISLRDGKYAFMPATVAILSNLWRPNKKAKDGATGEDTDVEEEKNEHPSSLNALVKAKFNEAEGVDPRTRHRWLRHVVAERKLDKKAKEEEEEHTPPLFAQYVVSSLNVQHLFWEHLCVF